MILYDSFGRRYKFIKAHRRFQHYGANAACGTCRVESVNYSRRENYSLGLRRSNLRLPCSEMTRRPLYCPATGKVRRTERNAHRAASSYRRRFGSKHKMNVYLCDDCGDWHIGHERGEAGRLAPIQRKGEDGHY